MRSERYWMSFALMVRPLFLILILFSSLPAFGQQKKGKERIELVRANTLEFDRSKGEDARRLIGNVRFRHGEATMDCDSAYLYASSEKLRAFGNVHIIHNDSIHLYGDSLYYDGADRFARLRGNVKVKDPQMTLWTDVLDYRIGSSRADFRDGGRLKVHKSEHRLKSQKGTYFTDAQRVHFKEDVLLSHPDYEVHSDTMVYHPSRRKAFYHGPTVMRSEGETVYCKEGWYDGRTEQAFLTNDPYVTRGSSTLEADTILYWNEEGRGKAFGRVALSDTAEDLRAYGGRGRYLREGQRFMLTRNPVVEQPFEEDTLYLRGDTIKGYKDSSSESQVLIVHPEVRFYRKGLQGRCDSLSYEEKDSTVRLFQEPVLWTGEDDRIFGDSILIRLREEGIRSIEIPSSPFISSRRSPPYFDQMTGTRMKAYMNEEDRVERIDIEGDGRTVHFPEEEEKKKKGENEEDDKEEGKSAEEGLIGMNRTASSRIRIRFSEEGMRSVSFFEKPNATLYPMDELKEDELRLEGFQWDEKGRARGVSDITEGAWIHDER